ncbi:MAG: ferrochelatase [Anaerolineae bacterium]|nr:ferrochelatase [Anaerolineae bacterium]
MRTGLLITNLGTPDAPTPSAVRRYLAAFMADPRVFEFPKALWWLLVHGVILNTRPRKSAAKYASIWTPDGSPMAVISKHQQAAIRAQLRAQLLTEMPVALGMRYGNPSIESALEELRQADVRRLLVLPLYAQYSATTVASTYDVVFDVLKRWRWMPEVRTITHYHDDPAYIEALVNSIRAYWSAQPPPEKLLFSFHGLPQRYFTAGDPYYYQCMKTAELVARQLDLPEAQYGVAFQSRFGSEPWMQPYTDETLIAWGKAGVKSVHVVCPGFSADCLETLEEIEGENRENFLHAGGQSYGYIPALNDAPDHINALTNLVIRNMIGWPDLDHVVQTLNAKHIGLASQPAPEMVRVGIEQ